MQERILHYEVSALKLSFLLSIHLIEWQLMAT